MENMTGEMTNLLKQQSTAMTAAAPPGLSWTRLVSKATSWRTYALGAGHRNASNALASLATLRPPDFQLFSLKDDPDGL